MPGTTTTRLLVALAALAAAGCTTLRAPDAAPGREGHDPVAELTPQPLESGAFRIAPEPITVEDHWLLDLYTWIKGDGYESFRVEFPGSDGRAGVAHLLLPDGAGPHPAVMVFPILGGDHLVSEMLAKALVYQGYAALRMERRRLFPKEDEPPESDFAAAATRLRHTILDARMLLDWLELHPRIDGDRLAAAGVSVGGIMAATLMGLDRRVKAGVFIMAGGGLPEILHDSTEGPLRRFRDHVFETTGDRSREGFLRRTRPHTEALDPLTYAGRIDPRRAVLISCRFDRVVPPERTEALWEALGRPDWHRVPAGHYQIAPFFWWSVGLGADLLDDVFGREG